MGWISTVFVHKALDAAMSLDCIDEPACDAVLHRLGMDPTSGPKPNAMVSDHEFFDVLEQLDAASPQGHLIPILMGGSMRCDDYGAFGLAFKSAPTLLGSFTRVERFGKTVTSIANFRVKQTNASVFVDVIQGNERRRGLVMTNHLALAAAQALSREVSTSEFRPVAVHLMARSPRDANRYRDHFGCPVFFEAERDGLEVAIQAANQPNWLSDPGMSRFFDAHLDKELAQMDHLTGLERRVLDMIVNTLSEGVPPLANVARRLGMSSRTLQRRLAADGLAYQDLVVNAQQTLSRQLVRQTDYALAEITFLTGFSDQSTFTRAFKRWHGKTPARYRRDS